MPDGAAEPDMFCLTACFLAAIATAAPASAAEGSKCAMIPPVLWGDGAHDDTAALNAWFRGGRVDWARTGRPVGALIVGHVFRLKGAVFIHSGTNRSIEQFELVWPERRERVSGGAIHTGSDPDQPPVATGIVKTGAGPNEGVAFPSPDLKPADSRTGTDCLVS